MPLQFGLTITADNQLVSKWLNILLSRLEFSVSQDRVWIFLLMHNRKLTKREISFKKFYQYLIVFIEYPGHAGIPGLWTQKLDAGLWALDTKPLTLDAARRWTPNVERQAVDVKTLKSKTVQSIGNNGSISMTSFLNSTLIKIFG